MRAASFILSAFFVLAAVVASSPFARGEFDPRQGRRSADHPYDIQQRTQLLTMTGVKGGQKAATEELIDETIQFIEAAKMGIPVSDARVDVAIEEIATRVKMTPSS